MTEYIDGPVEAAIGLDHDEAYASFAELTGLFADIIARGGLSDVGSEAPRLTSWVEQSDSRFGHALLVSKPELVDGEFVKPETEVSLLTLDREQHVQVGEPKILKVPLDPTEEQVDEYCEYIISNFSEYEVRLMLAMIKKSHDAYSIGQRAVLDGDVQLTLVEENLEQLAVMYGDAATPEQEPEPTGPKGCRVTPSRSSQNGLFRSVCSN